MSAPTSSVQQTTMAAATGFLKQHWLAGVVVVLLALAWAWNERHPVASQAGQPNRLALLIPDDLPRDHLQVQAWQDAAVEVGATLEVLTASDLLRLGMPLADRALILPDGIHREMNDLLVSHLSALVHSGTRLMLVQDAGIADPAGMYHPGQSRFSELAGVRYAVYGELGTMMAADQVVWADPKGLPLLRMPPGKLMREGGAQPLISTQPVPQAGEELAVVGYRYGRLHYPVYATRDASRNVSPAAAADATRNPARRPYDGLRLMHAESGLVAGLRRVGEGQVLFVNLPLGYLKLRTDGLFLHSFLRLFAEDVAELPLLSPMPAGRGALIMNWHIDAAAAVPAMETLTALRAFEQGPYSMHLTVGPDVDHVGDGQGMDLARNPAMRDWVRRFTERGDEVGSHGGWIHNEFGRLVDVQDRSRSADLIERNSSVLSAVSGKPVREYSAPTGNHPAWVTAWLHERGVKAYYFTGDIGMAPTRSFQDGQRSPSEMWAFPVLSYGALASFEEARQLKVRDIDIAAWLNDVADYCANYRTVRLVYFHPAGIAIFADAFSQWMTHTAQLVSRGALHWMTMTQYAGFANRRLQVQWALSADTSAPAAAPPGDEWMRLDASHPTALAEMSWQLPVQRYAQPTVLQGQARVERDGADWRVVATGGTALQLRLSRHRLGDIPIQALIPKEAMP